MDQIEMTTQNALMVQEAHSTRLSDDIRKLITDHIGMAENLGVAVLNRDRQHIFFNPQYREILQLNSQTLNPSARFEDILPKEHRDANDDPTNTSAIGKIIEQMNLNLNVGQTVNDTLDIVTADGSNLAFNIVYTPDHFMVATVKNVSAELQSEKILNVAMDAGNAGYWAYDFETSKFTFSESVRSRLSADELRRIDQTGLWAIMETEDLPLVMKEWGELISDGKDLDLTYRVTTERDGTMWQRSVGKVQYDDQGNRCKVIAFVTDITADVAKNEALVAAEDASRAKSDFLARMSHEVKTPLNAIVGLTDALKDEDISAEVRETVQLIENSAEGLHELLTLTLDHAKLLSEDVSLNLHPESPAEIVRETCSQWRPKCSMKGLELNVDIDSNVPESVLLDRYRLQQCLNNLLSNAVKFTHMGSISVSMKQLDQDGSMNLVIIVRDSGIGMTADQCDKAFKAFEQADTSITRNFGGTGLGLSNTEQLVNLMGGHISLRSVPGEGTAFAVGIPIKQNAETVIDPIDQELESFKEIEDIPEAVAPQGIQPTLAVNNEEGKPETETVKADALAGLSILCVEDNPTNQHVVKKLIGKQVANLKFANNGREAIDLLRIISFDIILMDIHMPVMDGIEATIEIRNSDADWADVIIIALTADSDYQQARICRNLGMNDTIGKPVKRQDILDAFERVLEHVGETHGRKVQLSA